MIIIVILHFDRYVVIISGVVIAHLVVIDIDSVVISRSVYCVVFDCVMFDCIAAARGVIIVIVVFISVHSCASVRDVSMRSCASVHDVCDAVVHSCGVDISMFVVVHSCDVSTHTRDYFMHCCAYSVFCRVIVCIRCVINNVAMFVGEYYALIFLTRFCQLMYCSYDLVGHR